jgi:hypothetical protein
MHSDLWETYVEPSDDMSFVSPIYYVQTLWVNLTISCHGFVEPSGGWVLLSSMYRIFGKPLPFPAMHMQSPLEDVGAGSVI